MEGLAPGIAALAAEADAADVASPRSGELEPRDIPVVNKQSTSLLQQSHVRGGVSPLARISQSPKTRTVNVRESETV